MTASMRRCSLRDFPGGARPCSAPYARYLRQTDIPYSLDYFWGTLRRYPAFATLLTELFTARFEPGLKQRERSESRIANEIEAALETVASLDDDTILRAFRQVIEATVRTDFFVGGDDEEPAAITLKIKPADLPFVRLPRPFREIFVHSPEVEGVHLRFGPVARGGLRWSDRPQDFRTEVLGLVKAQHREERRHRADRREGRLRAPSACRRPGRDQIFEAGRQAYIRFVDRLLSLTDDIDGRRGRRRRRMSSGTMATIPTSSSPPTRAPRPSPTPPTE